MPADIRSFLSPPSVEKHNLSPSPDVQVSTKRRRIVVVESSPELEASPKKISKVGALDDDDDKSNNKTAAAQSLNGIAEEKKHNGNITSAGEDNNSKQSLSVQEKEQRLVELRKLLPTVNDLQAQEVLVRANWSVERARKKLAETLSSSSSEHEKSLNTSGETFDNVEDYRKSKKRSSENGSSGRSSGSHNNNSSASTTSPHKSNHHKSSSHSRSSSSSGHRSSSENHKSPLKHSSSSSSTSHHHHHHKSSSSSHKSPSKSHHHHPSSSSSTSTTSRDKEKDKERDKDRERDKDKEKRRSDEGKKEDRHHKSSSHRHHHHHSSNGSSSSSKSHHKDKHRSEEKKREHSTKAAAAGSDDDQDDIVNMNHSVYDSDADSDDESNFVMNKSRQMVLDFLNEASQLQLTAVKTFSVKKADLLMQLRPIANWRSLLKAIQDSKGLSFDLLNHCQELLARRQKMSVLLNKCKKIIRNLERAIEATRDGAAEQPKLLSEEMKLADYQLVGLNWLIMMHREGFNGILADEMGLGKTIQVIAFLTYLKEHHLSSVPNLIVVPSSTMDNWDNEMAKWSPELVVAKYYGSQDERRALRMSFAKGGLEGVDVILTTYHTVASLPEERKMFRTIKIDYVVFDEAHMLKNMTTQRYEYLSKINAEHRLLLTGTPLQNNLMELMSLLCFVMPKLFSGSVEDFKTLFQKSGKQQKTTEVSPDGEPMTSFEQSQIEQAKLVMKPFVLRRLKKDVLQCLPPKSSTVINVKMSAGQAERYTELVEGFKMRRELFDDDTSGMTVMMDMRKLTNHPLLMRSFFTDEKLKEIAKRLSTDLEYKKENAEYIFEDLAIMSDFQVYQMAQKYTSTKNYKIPKELVMDCGKFNELDKLLPELRKEGHRVLIFSQFTMMLDILEKYLEYKKLGYLRLDGSTNVTERQDMIDDFNHAPEKYFVFLLSTRAGGLGINLTSADTVVIYDIDFNPYNDKQAEDRCHRLGQTKPVHIYKLVTDNSIEEGMYAAAQEKLNLERDVTNVEGGQDDSENKCMVKLLSSALGLVNKKK